MVKKSIALFLILLGSWSLFLSLNKQKFFFRRGLWAKNAITIESFISNKNKIDFLFLGSCLTQNIPMHFFPFNVYNLGLAGHGSDGLLLMNLNGKPRVKTIFIEVNTVTNYNNKNSLKNYWNNDFNLFLKLNLNFLSTINQPIELLKDYLHNKLIELNQKKGISEFYSDKVAKNELIKR